MKTLYILASPRKNGACETLFALLKDRWPGESIRVYEKKILPCVGCDRCREEKKCFIEDDMTEIYEKMKNASRMIVLSPVYFFGFPAPLKVLIDRTQVFWHHPLPKTKTLLCVMAGEMPNQSFLPFYEKIWHYLAQNWGAERQKFILAGNMKPPFVFSEAFLNQCHEFLKGSEA